MTTIACNRQEMAADSLAVTDNRKCRVRKLFRGRGAIIGVSGSAEHAVMFVHWYHNGADLNDRPRDLDIGALVLDKNGVFRYEGNCYPYEVLDEFAAVGSGADAGLAAMIMGATPERAVTVACEVDLHTGPPVVVATL